MFKESCRYRTTLGYFGPGSKLGVSTILHSLMSKILMYSIELGLVILMVLEYSYYHMSSSSSD